MRRDPATMNRTLLIIVVLAVGLNDVAAGAAGPAIATMIKAMPGVSVTLIQMLVTLPNLVIIFVSPLYGWLCTKIQPRKIIIFGLTAFLIGGAMPVFLDNIWAILAFRALLGVGSGITIPAALALVPTFFDGSLRDKLIGWNTAIGCIGAMCMQSLAGYLTVLDWHYCFLAYLFPIWVLVLTVLFLPDVPMAREMDRETNRAEPDAPRKNIFSRMPWQVYGLVLVYLIHAIFRSILPVTASIIIEGGGYGTAANSGLALSLYTAGATVGSFFFGYLKRFLKGFTLAFIWLLVGVGFLAFAYSQSLTAFNVTAFISGMGMGAGVAGYFARVSDYAPKAYAAFGISLIACVQGGGNFIQPLLMEQVLRLTGQTVGRFSLGLGAVCLLAGGVVLALVQIVSAGLSKKREGAATKA